MQLLRPQVQKSLDLPPEPGHHSDVRRTEQAKTLKLQWQMACRLRGPCEREYCLNRCDYNLKSEDIAMQCIELDVILLDPDFNASRQDTHTVLE